MSRTFLPIWRPSQLPAWQPARLPNHPLAHPPALSCSLARLPPCLPAHLPACTLARLAIRVPIHPLAQTPLTQPHACVPARLSTRPPASGNSHVRLAAISPNRFPPRRDEHLSRCFCAGGEGSQARTDVRPEGDLPCDVLTMSTDSSASEDEYPELEARVPQQPT